MNFQQQGDEALGMGTERAVSTVRQLVAIYVSTVSYHRCV